MALSNEEMMLKERMQFVLSARKMTIADFADRDETVRVRYTHQINGSGKVPYDTIYRLLYMFPDIDANWLVLGEGGMTRAEHLAPRVYNQQRTEVHDHATNTNNFGGSIPYPVQALLDEKDKRIAELEKDKTQLQGLLAVFTRQAEAKGPKKK